MKIQINITETSKEVIVEESCNLKELATFIQVSFPDHYPEFKIVPKVIKDYVKPYIINPYTSPYWQQPYYLYNPYPTTAGSSNYPPSTTTKLVNGTYNVDVQMRQTLNT